MPEHFLIPLHAADGTVRGHALVDAEDAHLGEHSWSLTTEGYARRTPRVDGRKTCVYLHRLIAGAQTGQDVDHVNRDRLDCRRSNLRLCTRAQNLQNVAGRGGTSRHRGVSWHAKAERWRADVKVGGKQHYLGLFDSEESAAEAAIAARERLMTHAVA